MKTYQIGGLQHSIKRLREQLAIDDKRRRRLPHGEDRARLWNAVQLAKQNIKMQEQELTGLIAEHLSETTPRTCILCEHMGFHPGEEDYSEYTPGVQWGLWCEKAHWRMEGGETTDFEYRQNLLKAVDCPDFQPSHLLLEIQL